MLTKIKCPKCNTEGTFSCHPVTKGRIAAEMRELLKIKMEHGSLISVVQMDPRKWPTEEIRAMKEKFRH